MKPTMLLIMFTLMLSGMDAQILFVRQDASGTGTSWSDATGDLAFALSFAKAGTQVWVAQGTYKPTKGKDRRASFVIPDGVQVLGGFSGNETDASQRNPVENPTVLSGEIGEMGIADNSYNVVYIGHAGGNTLLDGFVITAGNANGDATEESSRTRCGGGLYLNGSNGSICQPVIRNCIFSNNMGRDGAAVYINARNGAGSPAFVNCVFKNNEAGLDGGAIFNDGRQKGKSNPTLTNCHFERNLGTYGGAICNASEDGDCNLTLENCVFIENGALLRGGALCSLNGDEKCYLDISGCQFQNNFPDDQNMVFTSPAARSKGFRIAAAQSSPGR